MAQLQSPRACLNCKSKKKKCSRAVPSCVSCNRLLLKCVYPAGSSNIEQPPIPKSFCEQNECYSSTRPLSSPPLEILYHAQCVNLFSGWRASARLLGSLNGLSQDPTRPDTGMFHTSIMKEVLQIITEDGGSLPALFDEYYRTIDAWLPGIVPQSEILSRVKCEPMSDLALLLLCMFLVIQLPNDKGPGQTSMHNSIYFSAKSLLSTLLSAGFTSLDTIRAAALILLYEVGHGMNDQAYLSTSLCYRLSLRFMPSLDQYDVTTAKGTNEGRLWWSIVMLDRYLNLGVAPNELDLISDNARFRGRTAPSISSLEHAFDKQTVLTLSLPRSESGTASFDRSAAFIQAAALLGQVYEYTRLLYAEKGQHFDTYQALDRSLQSLLKDLLVQSTRSWEDSCESIGLCFSALFTLHEAQYERGDKVCKDLTDHTQNQCALMSIKSVIKMVLEIAENINTRTASVSISALPIPSTYATYRAAMFHIETSSDRLDTPEWRLEMDLLKTALGRYGNRWAVGKHYLNLVNDSVQKARVRNYNQDPHKHILAS